MLFPYGSPNTLGVGALCYVAFAMIAPHVTMGSMYIDMFSDIDRAGLVLIWGKNPAAHCPPDDFIKIEAAHKRGAEIVVIDPRKTAMARYPHAVGSQSDPGTDGCLALGCAMCCSRRSCTTRPLRKNWAAGFDEFGSTCSISGRITWRASRGSRPTLSSLSPERWRSADGVAPVMYTGLEYNGNGVQTIRAVHVLLALAGQLDVPGGLCFKMTANSFP